jgi:hypothetical protein
VSGCALLIKSKVIDEIGMLDPNYFLYVEEKDWCMRARLQGFSCLYVPDGQVWHKGSVSTEKNTALKDYYMLRGQILFLKKFYNGFWCCVGVLLFFGFQIIIAAKKSINNRDTIFLKACLKGLGDGLLNNYIYRWPQVSERGK